MKFDLKAPCAQCPFRTDIEPFLRAERVEKILDAITDEQRTFTCHKTAKYDDDGKRALYGEPQEQHCAGALILLEKIKQPNQLMRIFERLGAYDRTKLAMDAPVFDTPEDMMDSVDA